MNPMDDNGINYGSCDQQSRMIELLQKTLNNV